MEYVSFGMLLLGIVVGITLIFINVRIRSSLLGSFFRKSYAFATAGCVAFSLGFLSELIGLFFPEINLFILSHAFLLVSIFLFALVGILFPKEASEALSEKNQDLRK